MNHFETSEYYLKLNQKFSTEFYKSRVYESLGLAVYDITSSLLQFLSHRPKVAVIRSGVAVFEAQIAIFLRQQTPLQFKPINQTIHQFIQEIDKETNFVLWSAENEVTGEIIYSDEVCLEIHKLLTERKIFSIQIAQASRNINKNEIFKNGLSILIETSNLFVESRVQAYFTDKLKAPSLIGPFQNMKNIFSSTESLSAFPTQVSLDLLAEYLYEKQFSAGIPFLKDRQVFLFKKCSGDYLKQSLLQQKALETADIFAPSSLPTWTLETFKNWWPESEKQTLILGLVVISNQAFQKNSLLEKTILEIYQKQQHESSWTVV